MLLVPILLGVAASQASPWHVVLGGAALAGYLASAAVQTWSRARRPPELVLPIVVYGAAFASLGLVLAIAFPSLLFVAIVALPATLVVVGGARPGTRRDVANSLAQVAQAVVLVAAAALVSGQLDPERVVVATLVATGYLVGTVLVVRSVLRERGNEAFAALSIGFHAGLVVLAFGGLALGSLSWPYAALAIGLAVRAVAVPWTQRRLAGSARPMRPIHVGIVEIVSSVTVVVVAFVA